MKINVLSHGAIDDGVTDATDAIQSAVNCMNNGDTLYFPTECGGYYRVSDTIVLPPKNLMFEGDGIGSATLLMSAPKPLFYYSRPAGAYSSILSFRGLTFIRSGLPKDTGSYAIWTKGLDDNHADNYLRVSECAFYGWEAAIKAKWTGQSRVEKCFFQANKYSTYLERGASFWSYRDCMSFDNTFIFGNDPLADGYSNAIFIDACNNICAAGTNIDLTGWQSVYIDKCGWDLGSAGAAALSFNKCSDVAIAKSYISGNSIAARMGVKLIDTPRVSITNNRIVNCSYGVFADFAAPFASALVVDGNEFDGNVHNDVLFRANVTASKVVNNHFAKQMARAGSDFEVFVYTTGSDSNIVAFNTFHGAPYGMGPMPNSVVGSNVFNAPAG